MHEIPLKTTGKRFQVPDLTRKQMRDLEKAGLFDRVNRDRAMDAEDALLVAAFPDRQAEIDELPNRDARQLVLETIAYSYGSGAEEKNS